MARAGLLTLTLAACCWLTPFVDGASSSSSSAAAQRPSLASPLSSSNSLTPSSTVSPTTTVFTPTQYHIQTDDGDQRFFKYQTWSGQFRKETRLEGGAVVGTYGWVDANGILRLYDYMADQLGYRILDKRSFKVGRDQIKASPLPNAPAPVRSVIPTKAGPLEVPFKVEGLGQLPKAKPTVATPTTTTRTSVEEETNQIDVDLPSLKNRNRSQHGRRLGKAKSKGKGKVTRKLTAIKKRLLTTPNSRLQRRISGGGLVPVEPLFDSLPLPSQSQNQVSPVLLQRFTAKPQARGEGSRLVYAPDSVSLPVQSQTQSQAREQKAVGRFEADRPRSNRGRFVVVKRRRRPNAELERGPHALDYQTSKTFHKEKLLEDGQRRGEFGYIDPIGVRRVVTYATGPRGRLLQREKENDYVGEDSYFEAS